MVALSTDRKTFSMPEPAVTTEIHEPFDVHRNVAAKIAFDLVFGFEDLADFGDVLFRRFVGVQVVRKARSIQNPAGDERADAVDISQRDPHLFVSRKVNTSD